MSPWVGGTGSESGRLEKVRAPLQGGAGASRQIPAWNRELTFELELPGKGLHFDGEPVEVQLEQALEVLQHLGAEVAPGPGPQEADGAQRGVPAVRLQLAQPARALRVRPAVVGKRGGLEHAEGERVLCGRARGARGPGG